MNVLLFLCKGFETMEASVFIDVFGWARNDYGADIQVMTAGFEKEVVSTFGIPVIVDQLWKDICVEEYDALVIPGGFEEFGFYEEAYDMRFMDLIKCFHKQGKLIVSVCVGALPIAKSGVLKGRKATTYHQRNGYRQKELAAFGVDVIEEPVVMDDNVITSWCPSTAVEVAFLTLHQLLGEEITHTVREAMGY